MNNAVRNAGSPVLVLVNGFPATGKTTFARMLSDASGLPLFCKDDFKEQLFNTFNVTTREEGKVVGRTAYALLDHVARMLLGKRLSLILEANFEADVSGPWIAELQEGFSARAVQVYLKAEPGVVLQRYRERDRHPGHMDDIAASELEEMLRFPLEPLEIDGPTFELDTTSPDDSMADRVVTKVIDTAGLAGNAFRR